MIELLPESTETCIGFKISGKVTFEDYDALMGKLNDVIAAHGHLNLLVLMEDFEGWLDMDAAKADFKFGTDQYQQVEKTAFVSRKKWMEWAVKIMDPFTRMTEEEYYEPHQLKEAWAWILEDD